MADAPKHIAACEPQLGEKGEDWLSLNLQRRDRDARHNQTGRRDGAPPSHPNPLPESVILTFLVKLPQCLSCLRVIDIKFLSEESLHLLHCRIHLSNSRRCLYSIQLNPIRLHVTSAGPRSFLSRLLTYFLVYTRCLSNLLCPFDQLLQRLALLLFNLNAILDTSPTIRVDT